MRRYKLLQHFRNIPFAPAFAMLYSWNRAPVIHSPKIHAGVAPITPISHALRQTLRESAYKFLSFFTQSWAPRGSSRAYSPPLVKCHPLAGSLCREAAADPGWRDYLFVLRQRRQRRHAPVRGRQPAAAPPIDRKRAGLERVRSGGA